MMEKIKAWHCTDGRVVYGVKCIRCGKRSHTRNKELAEKKRYLCRACTLKAIGKVEAKNERVQPPETEIKRRQAEVRSWTDRSKGKPEMEMAYPELKPKKSLWERFVDWFCP